MWESPLGSVVIIQSETIVHWTRIVVLEVQRNGQNLGILKAKLARSAVGLDMRCQRRRKVMNDSKV